MDWSNLKNKGKTLFTNESNSEGTPKLRLWLISLFTKTIHAVSQEQDRIDILSWLALVRVILNNGALTKSEKSKEIYSISDSKKTAGIVMRSVSTSVKNYKNSDLPLSIKIAIPATLGAATLIGGQGVGLAAFGSAIGLPVLLLVFLGAAGITAVLEAFIVSKDARSYLGVVINLIVRDEIYRRAKKDLQEAMVASPLEPKKYPMPEDELLLRQQLLAMDPFEFEQHVMSFFQHQGLLSWVTKRSNDAGVDGFAKHEKGLIVVQCKRNSPTNLIGRPVIQQFKGVVEENQAWRGYVVVTSDFTQEAKDSAAMNSLLVLVNMDELVKWHCEKNINF